MCVKYMHAYTIIYVVHRHQHTQQVDNRIIVGMKQLNQILYCNDTATQCNATY